MFDEVRALIASKAETRPVDGSSKVMPLSEAVRKFIRPGMAVHLGNPRAMALFYEVMRQFRGQQPDFTIIAGGFISLLGGHAMVRAGLVKKVITGYIGATYPTPGPSRTFQTAVAEGQLEVEHWTLLTQALRLKAAAMGVPFLVTNSLIGSNMERDNAHAFRVVDDPFRPGERIGLVQALQPDVSLVHGLAADQNGNIVIPPPLGENTWGAMAARGGVIATVERIIPTESLRLHNHFVRVPGYFVRAVCEVPFGAHPSSLNSQWAQGLDGYAEDYDFMLEARRADRGPENLDAWAEKWIYSVNNHQEYLDKVGFQRLLFLRGKAQWDSYGQELESVKDKIDLGAEFNSVEQMVAVSSRLIAGIVRAKEYKTILAGVGASNLAGWLANAKLKDLGCDVDLMAEVGFYGYTPRPADPFIFNHRNISTCKELADIEHVLGIFVSGKQNRCLGSLAAGQVDKHGNINTTMVAPKMLIAGSGGGNDVASSATEVVITVAQSRARFLDNVDYITSPGRKAKTLVSNLGVYEKLGDDDEFTLTGYLVRPGLENEGQAVQNIKEQCGWELKVARKLVRHEGPSLEELRLMRSFDPHRQFLGE